MFKHLVFSLVLIVPASSTTPVLGQGSKPVGDDRAKQLFQEMEQRLAKAKSLECAFEIKAEWASGGDPRKTMLLEGSLFLADGNRVREEMNERTDGRPLFKFLVSDGARWWWHDKGSPPHLVDKKPWASLNADFLTSLARAGFFLPTAPLPPVEAADGKDRFPVSGFRLGPKEKLGEREAQRLEHQLFIKGQKGPKGEELSFPVTVWLDPQTSLPIKRMLSLKFVGTKEPELVITESYGKLVLDGEVNAKKFELPKKTEDTIVESR